MVIKIVFWYLLYTVAAVFVIRDFSMFLFGDTVIGFLVGLVACYQAGVFGVQYTGLDQYIEDSIRGK